MSDLNDATDNLALSIHLILRLPSRRELPRQPRETEAQICNRRGTLVSLDTARDDDRFWSVTAMAYMADL